MLIMLQQNITQQPENSSVKNAKCKKIFIFAFDILTEHRKVF